MSKIECSEEIYALTLKYLDEKILRQRVPKPLPKLKLCRDGVRNFLEIIKNDLEINHNIKALSPNLLYYDDLVHMGYDYKEAALHNDRARYLIRFQNSNELIFTMLIYGDIFEVPSRNHLSYLFLQEI